MRGDIGMNYNKYAKDAANEIIGLKDKLKKVTTAEYEKIPKNTNINLTQNRTLEKMNDAILDFETHTKSYPRPEEVEKATNILNNVRPALTKTEQETAQKIKINPLMQEASKYKTANEFINAIQTNKSKIGLDDIYKYEGTILEPQKKDFTKSIDYFEALKKYNNLKNRGWFDLATDIWDKSQKTPKQSITQATMSFESLKDATEELSERAEKAYKNGDYKISKMYQNMRNALVEARDTDPKIAKASKTYSDLKKALDTLEKGLGVNLDNPKNVESKIFSGSKDASGEFAVNKLDEVMETLKKYPQTKDLSKIHDKIKLAQVAYDLRPSEESKFLSQIKSIPLALLGEPSAQRRAEQLSKRLASGKISPSDLETFELSKGGNLLNKFIQRQKAYGGTIPTMANAVKKLQLSRYTLPKLTIMDLLKNSEENK